MAEVTKIEWCDHTFNSWRGCTKVSTGCTNCYAETLSKRNPRVLGVWGEQGTRVVASDAAWRQPWKWDRAAKAAGVRRKVFCASLADVFEDREELCRPRGRLFRLILDTPNLDWLILTKRPGTWFKVVRDTLDSWDSVVPGRKRDVAYAWASDWLHGQAPENVWLGTSIEDQGTADERTPLLLSVPAKVRFLSMEPLLGPVDLGAWLPGPLIDRCRYFDSVESLPVMTDGGTEVKHFPKRPTLDWVILGGESGPKARRCDLAWVRSIRDQCRPAGVSCFIKQLGGNPYDSAARVSISGPDSHSVALDLRDRKGGDWLEWGEDLRVREFPTGVAS